MKKIFKLNEENNKIIFDKCKNLFNTDSVILYDLLDNNVSIQILVTNNKNKIIGIYKTDNTSIIYFKESLNLLNNFLKFNFEINTIQSVKKFLNIYKESILNVFEYNNQFLNKKLSKKDIYDIVNLFKSNNIRVYNVDIQYVVDYLSTSDFLNKNKKNLPFKDFFENERTKQI